MGSPLNLAFTARMTTIASIANLSTTSQRNVDMNSGSKIRLTNSSVFPASCTHQKPFQLALVSVVSKIKEKQTQATQTPI